MNDRVLVIDDDIKLQKLLKTYLLEYGIEVHSALDGNNVKELLSSTNPDIVILDIVLPGKNGFEILKEIRENSAVPVIMLSAKGEDTDRIVGLELGADDYVPKPCNPRELLARIKAVLRRIQHMDGAAGAPERFIKGGNLTLDRSRQSLFYEEQSIQLSSMEFMIMEALMLKPGQVLTRDQLMTHARGQEGISFDRSIDMHISKLRAKIESISGEREMIKTVWGSGYMFVGDL